MQLKKQGIMYRNIIKAQNATFMRKNNIKAHENERGNIKARITNYSKKKEECVLSKK